MTNSENKRAWWQRRKNLQLAAALGTFVVLVLLAYLRKWPFHQEPLDLGDNPSPFEILMNERVTLGLVRAALAAVVIYAVVSVPALIVGGRWMKGLTTSGLTADDAETADKAIEELQTELRATQEELQDQVTQTDLLSEWFLEYGGASGDNEDQEGT